MYLLNIDTNYKHQYRLQPLNMVNHEMIALIYFQQNMIPKYPWPATTPENYEFDLFVQHKSLILLKMLVFLP
jgi:hypothetical protein